MKIEVNFTMKFKETIFLNEEQLLDIGENYDYDFMRWIKDTLDLLENAECIDTKIDSVSFDAKEFDKQRLKLLKKDIEKNKNRLIFSNFLSLKSTKPNDLEQWEDITKLFDIQTLGIVDLFCDINNPKFELDYIHIDNDYLKATNGKIVIRQKLKKGIEGEALFYGSFTRYLVKGARLYLSPKEELSEKRKTCLEYDDEYYITPSDFNYPNVEELFSDERLKTFDIVEDTLKWTFFRDGLNSKEKLKIILRNRELLVFDDDVLFELSKRVFLKMSKIGLKEEDFFTVLYLAGENFEIVTTAIELKVK